MARSMNADLHEGTTDGGYKKVIRDRGGVVEGGTERARVDLVDVYYGIHEVNPKVDPTGHVVNTPNYVPTRAPEPTV